MLNTGAHVRLLLLSDIHANLEALEACLAAAPACDDVANLGDSVGYGASPNEVVNRVRLLGDIFVRGNHDRACSGDYPINDFNPVATRAALWTREHLAPENRVWVRELPAGPITDSCWPGVQFVHGSPLNEDQYIINQPAAQLALEASPFPITFFGHTHAQGAFTLNGAEVSRVVLDMHNHSEAESSELELRPGLRYLINPGSVGQPRDGDPRAAFAVYDAEKHSVTFYRVPYELPLAQHRIIAAGLPERLALRLGEGR